MRLSRDDLMVLYTDGVTEARGAEGMLGGDQLAAVLRESAGLDASFSRSTH